MERLEPITGLLDRVEFRDFLSLSEPEQYEKINELHNTRVQAVHKAKTKPQKKQQTKSATKNKEKKQAGKKDENNLAKLLAKMTPEQREELKKKAGLT